MIEGWGLRFGRGKAGDGNHRDYNSHAVFQAELYIKNLTICANLLSFLIVRSISSPSGGFFLRILVISDTHGHIEIARKVIVERGPWDQIIHLGDSMADAVDLSAELKVNVLALPGNNEYPGSAPVDEEFIFEAEGVRFYAMHGHELELNPWDKNLEAALAELVKRALQAGASVALFGHTHVPLKKELGGVLLINPGAMGMGDHQKTYAVINVDESGETKAEILEV